MFKISGRYQLAVQPYSKVLQLSLTLATEFNVKKPQYRCGTRPVEQMKILRALKWWVHVMAASGEAESQNGPPRRPEI